MSQPGQLFSPDSFWNKPLPDNAPIDPSSPQLIVALSAEWHHEGAELNNGPWVSTDNGSTTFYSVPAGQPTVHVTLDGASAWDASLQQAFNAVPIPPDAHPAAGSDAHMTIYQPATDKFWEFWATHKDADGWHAGFGGAIQHASRSPGYYTTSSWPGASWRWGATATSLPLIGGVMRINELQSGSINHALAIAVPDPRAGVYAWPAQRSDGFGGPDDLPEGARLRLDPHLDLTKLNLPPITLTIARAVQRYGMVVVDKTGLAFNFFAEDPTTRPGYYPYFGPGGLFDNMWPYQFLGLNFPYTHLQVLQMHLCTSQWSPCTGR